MIPHTEGGKWLRVFENRVLKGLFGPNRGEVTGGWIKLHIEELNPLTPELNPAQHSLTKILMGILLLEPCILLKYA
jgi:hypothetical protein